MMQCAPRKPEPPVTRTRVSEGVDMDGYKLRNGLVLATCEYWESPSSFDGSWFQKQCDDDEKATGFSVERMRKEGVSGGPREERYLFSWLVFCITLCNHDVLNSNLCGTVGIETLNRPTFAFFSVSEKLGSLVPRPHTVGSVPLCVCFWMFSLRRTLHRGRWQHILLLLFTLH